MLIQERSGNSRARIQHEPLIPRELFDAVQDALFARRKGCYRRHEFAFGGCILRCGDCGAAITAERQKGHVYYHCTGRRGPCSQARWLREELLSEQLSAILAALRLPNPFLDYAFTRLRKAHADEARFGDMYRRRLQGRLQEAQQKLDALLELKISPGNRAGELLSEEEYLGRKRMLLGESDQIKAQLDSAHQEGRTWVDDCERFFAFTQHLVRRFERATAKDKQALLVLVATNLTLKEGAVAWEYKEPFKSLAALPVAGEHDPVRFEPRSPQGEAEPCPLYESWLGVLAKVRKHPLPLYLVAKAA